MNSNCGIFALVFGLYFNYFTSCLNEDVKFEFLNKREVLRFSKADKEMILRVHNEYRRNVTPPAADMKLMIWDENAEISAQVWADNCVFKHNVSFGHETVGQNLYHGADKTGARATFLWWNETVVYDFWSSYCPPGEQCGHYTQMVWADSYLLGCAISKCPLWNYVVCHYRPPGNVLGQIPYQVGVPCSQCDFDNGGFCNNNLCVSKQQCETLNIDCSCSLDCHNCGLLDSKQCHCTCKDGWDSLDCSRKCKDEHEYCRMNPGFPNKQSCARDTRIDKIYCRSMCDQCAELSSYFPLNFFDPEITGESGNKSDVCCNGLSCPYGEVLDTNFCECKLLCPGLKCGHETFGLNFQLHLISFIFYYLFA